VVLLAGTVLVTTTAASPNKSTTVADPIVKFMQYSKHGTRNNYSGGRARRKGEAPAHVHFFVNMGKRKKKTRTHVPGKILDKFAWDAYCLIHSAREGQYPEKLCHSSRRCDQVGFLPASYG